MTDRPGITKYLSQGMFALGSIFEERTSMAEPNTAGVIHFPSLDCMTNSAAFKHPLDTRALKRSPGDDNP